MLVVLSVAAWTLSACHSLSLAGGGPAPQCTGTLHAYEGKCLTNTAIVYLECTKGKGFSTTKEIGGAAGGSFRVVAGASVKFAYKKSQKEDTPVALQIVHDCLKIAEEASDSAAEKKVAHELSHQVTQDIDSFSQQVKETPHIKLSRSSATSGQKVGVRGVAFGAKETVDIYMNASLLKQITVNGKGAFGTTIAVPSDVPPASFPTEITATGETSLKSADVAFHPRPASGTTKGSGAGSGTGSDNAPLDSPGPDTPIQGCSIETTEIAQLQRSKDPTASGERIPADTYTVIAVSQETWANSNIQWFKINTEGRTGYVQDDAAEIASRSSACP